MKYRWFHFDWMPGEKGGRGLGVAIGVCLVQVCAMSSAFGADGAAPAAAETTIPGGDLVLAAYLALWGGVGAYLLYLGLRFADLDDRLDDLDRRLNELVGSEEHDGQSGG